MSSAPGGPRVSVFVTTYNHSLYVEEALDSLRRQTSDDFEVIITDDASTDGCADVIAAWLSRTGYPAQFIRNPVNRGICANRNTALARAKGAFVCSLSGDDAYEPERIERQLACFLTQPEHVAAVYSDVRVVDSQGRPCGPSVLVSTLRGATPPQGKVFTHVLAGNFIPAPAVMVRKSAIAAVGGYDESLFYEDLDMWLRLSFRFDFVYVSGQLVRHRTLENSMSNRRPNQPLIHKSFTKILMKWLDADTDQSTYLQVLHELLRNGAMQLVFADVGGARETLVIVAARDPRPGRRLLARVAMLPGSYLGARALRQLIRLGGRLKKRPFRIGQG
jgi:glycosyltransferase involved in cell wall biosynthesis